LGANPTERAAKSQDLNTALIFWSFFIKEKGQYSTILYPAARFLKAKRGGAVCVQQVGDTAAALRLGLVG
jgi:hypothetical protein